MQFSIITPSFRSSEWLKLCIPSVADQGVELEHIVQDSCSDDGTQDWLRQDRRVTAFIEKDKGMYDAVNRGWKRAQGEILAYLNCDEQYLPGALQAAWDYFRKNPEVEMMFADTVIVESDGKFKCYRKATAPHKYHTWVTTNLCVLTAATFIRRSVIDQRELFFNPKYRAAGDLDWIMRAIEKKVKMACFSHFTSAFAETGVNMDLLPNGQREKKEMAAGAPGWAKKMRLGLIAQHRLRKALGGAYRQEPFAYSIYTKQSSEKRVTFQVDKPTARWMR